MTPLTRSSRRKAIARGVGDSLADLSNHMPSVRQEEDGSTKATSSATSQQEAITDLPKAKHTKKGKSSKKKNKNKNKKSRKVRKPTKHQLQKMKKFYAIKQGKKAKKNTVGGNVLVSKKKDKNHADLRRTIATLRNDKLRLVKSVAELEDRLIAVQDKMSEKEGEWEMAREDLMDRLDDMEMEVNVSREENLRVEKVKTLLASVLEMSRDANKKLEYANQDLMVALGRYGIEVEDLKDEKSLLEEIIKDYRMDLEQRDIAHAKALEHLREENTRLSKLVKTKDA